MVSARMISPVAAWMMRTLRPSMSMMMRVPLRVRLMPMWCRAGYADLVNWARTLGTLVTVFGAPRLARCCATSSWSPVW